MSESVSVICISYCISLHVLPAFPKLHNIILEELLILWTDEALLFKK